MSDQSTEQSRPKTEGVDGITNVPMGPTKQCLSLDQWVQYLDGSMEGRERKEMAGHIEICSTCRDREKEFRSFHCL